MGLFNWLFSKHTPAPKPSHIDNLEVDIVSKTDAVKYLLDNMLEVKSWYDISYEGEYSSQHKHLRNSFRQEVYGYGFPEFIIGDYLVYADKIVKVHVRRPTYLSDNLSDVIFMEYEIRPPVFRVVKDIDDNFCDWNYKRTTEYKYTSIKKLIKNRRDGIDAPIIREYSKNGIVIVNNNGTGQKYLTFDDVTVDLSENETDLITKVFTRNYNRVCREERDTAERKDTELRNQLDVAIAAVL